MGDKIIEISSRSIIALNGPNSYEFLQGLITNDINKIKNHNLLYTFMLNPQGRYLYDFFIFGIGENIYIDCLKSKRDEIIKKLNFFKLRSKFSIEINDDIKILSSFSKIDKVDSFIFYKEDPRSSLMGYRIYSSNKVEKKLNSEKYYHLNRIINKVPESDFDLTFDKSLINEFGFDELNAIDYKKGCYVGQEVVARTHYNSVLRKSIYYANIEGNQEIFKNQELFYEGKKIGIVLSSVTISQKIHCLILIRNDIFQDNLENYKNKITLDPEGKNNIIVIK